MAHQHVCVFVLLGLLGEPTPADVTHEALRVEVVRPDRVCERLIDLFQGTRAAHPAAALAAWKQATGRHLAKRTEALIALVNPAMVRELATFDGSSAVIRFERAGARVRWHAVVPHDDGSLAALATALVLTDGACEPPLEGLAVDRWGPPGSPLSAMSRGKFFMAGTRDDLRAALAGDAPPGPRAEVPAGLHVRLDPEAFRGAGSLPARRLGEGLAALGVDEVVGVLGLRGETLTAEVAGRVASPSTPRVRLEPEWLDWVPKESAVAAVALAIDPSPGAWDRLFAAADRVERADPARVGVAPLRTRLNLIASAAKVRAEIDLWPNLRGVSLVVFADPGGDVEGMTVALHTADEASAERIEGLVVPRVTASWVKGAEANERTAGHRSLGRVGNRPLRSARRGATVLVGWGESALRLCLEAKDKPKRSTGPSIREGWGPVPPQRAGALWPCRLPGLAPTDSPLAAALSDSPPVLWHGSDEARGSRDVIRWTDLRGLVRRFLERLPLSIPPGH
jgi:hypothetical protein